MSLFLLAWVSFLGADCAFRYGQLIGIDILTRNFPVNVQKIVQIVLFVAIIGALVVFTVFGVKLAFVSGARKFNSLPITYFYLYMSIPVASVSMVISAALKIRGIIAGLQKA